MVLSKPTFLIFRFDQTVSSPLLTESERLALVLQLCTKIITHSKAVKLTARRFGQGEL